MPLFLVLTLKALSDTFITPLCKQSTSPARLWITRKRLQSTRKIPAWLLLLFLPCISVAMELKVTKTTDSYDGVCDVDCSLREAITLAGSTPGSHKIRLRSGTYSLSLPAVINEVYQIYDEDENLNGDLDIHSELLIVGASMNGTVIDANYHDRIFDIIEGASLSLQSVTLTRGRHHYDGGAIRNLGTLILRDVKLTNNIAIYGLGQGRGGAIANYGNLSISYSEFVANRADFGDTNYALGGAIYNQNTLTIRDTAFRNNNVNTDDFLGEGGAIYNHGLADIARSVFINNSAEENGTAIYNSSQGKLVLTNATLSSNVGIEYVTAGTLTNYGEAMLNQVTIAENLRSYGVTNIGNLSIANSIIINNYDDIFSHDNPVNCINLGASFKYKMRGLLIGEGYNNCTADIFWEDSKALDEIFYPLDRNQSTLETYALRRLSPALDAAVGSCSSQDQRGLPRPQDGNNDGIASCDLGAYERKW